MQNFDFPYSVPVKIHAGPTVLDASAALTDVLSLSTASILYNVAVLASSGNPQYVPGLYISNGKTWRFIAPFSLLNMSVYRGYEINIYVGLSAPATPAPSTFLAFKNGIRTTVPTTIPANDRGLYVTVRAVDASLDENGKVPPSQLPSTIQGGLRWAGLEPPYSGLYDADQGIDTGTNAQIPAPSADNVGKYWEVTVAGTQWGYDLLPGDWLVSAGTMYQRLSGSSTPVASYTNTGVVQIRQNGGIIIDPNGLIEVDPSQLGGVKTVNTQAPDANGNVQVNIADITNLQALLDSKVKQVNAILPVDGVLTLTAIDIGALDVALRGVANGVASLDADGTVPISQLPAAILGALRYQGAYDAATNTPALPTPDPTNLGFYWVVSVEGTQLGKDLKVGDWVVSNGTSYDVIDNQNTVSMVNGQTGIVVLKVLDIEGAVASVNGVTPNAQGEVVVPFATASVAGTVKVPADGGLVIAADGALTVSPDIVSSLGFTPINALYVALNGDPTKGNGKINNPFTTISDAVAAAVDGSIIVLLGVGVFAESVIVGDKQVGIIGQNGAAGNETLISISGFLEIASTKKVSVQNLGINWNGTGSGLRIVRNGGTSMRHIAVRTSSAAQAVLVDASGGAWTDPNVRIDGLSVNDGKIQIDTGTVSIRMMPEASNSIAEVNGGTVDLTEVWRLQRVDHTAGALTLDGVRQLGTSSAAPAVNSTAPATGNNFLTLRNVSTWASPSAQSYISKTGNCPYIVDGLTRNVANDVWAGTEIAQKSSYDRDTIVTRTGVNYTAPTGAYASVHLAGIDTALGLRLSTLTSAGGTSLVNNGSQGVLNGLAAGAGIGLAQNAGVITISNTGVAALSSVAGGTSLVNTTAGQLKAVAAGAGMTITETGGVLTFSSTASGGVTALNGLSGAITLTAGAGLSVSPSGQSITLTNTGVTALSSVAGGNSLVNTTSGQLRSLAAGANISIMEAAGILTISSTGGSGGVTTFNGTTGAITLEAGLGITITPNGNTFTVAALGGGSGIQAVVPSTGSGTSLIEDDGTTTAVAIIKRLIAGGGITLTESATGVTIDAMGGVSSVNSLNGDVQVVGGNDISVTINGDGHISVAYTGAAAGTKVDSLNGASGPLNLTSTSSNLAIDLVGSTFNFSVDGFLNTIDNAISASPDAVTLVSDTGSATGVGLIERLVPGANIQIDKGPDGITIHAVGGAGTVRSVNNIEPQDPLTGNVTIEAGDVGALPLTGGAMQGPIDMATNAIKNLPDPVDGGDPITLSFFNGGSFIIDNGVI